MAIPALTPASVVQTPNSGGTSATLNIPISASGNDRLVFVAGVSKDDSSTVNVLSTMVFDATGVNLSVGAGITQAATRQIAIESPYSSQADVYVIKEADLPSSAGTYAIDITMDGAMQYLYWIAFEVTGCNQTLDAIAVFSSTADVAAGGSYSQSITTTVADCLVIDFWGQSDSAAPTITPGTGQTQIGSNFSNTNGGGNCSYKGAATAGSVTMSQTTSTLSQRQAGILVSIAPVSTGISGSASPTEADDTGSAAGQVSVSGSGAPVEDTDTGSASGGIYATGTVSAIEADDAGAANGTVGSGITGTAAPVEDDDAGAAVGSVSVSGSASPSEDADIGAATGQISVLGTASPVEADDTGSASGSADTIGASAAVEDDDAGAASGTVAAIGAVSSVEDNDTGSASGVVGVITGTVAVTEDGDTGLASGFIGSIDGNAAAYESGDTGTGTGKVGIEIGVEPTQNVVASGALAATAVAPSGSVIPTTKSNGGSIDPT